MDVITNKLNLSFFHCKRLVFPTMTVKSLLKSNGSYNSLLKSLFNNSFTKSLENSDLSPWDSLLFHCFSCLCCWVLCFSCPWCPAFFNWIWCGSLMHQTCQLCPVWRLFLLSFVFILQDSSLSKEPSFTSFYSSWPCRFSFLSGHWRNKLYSRKIMSPIFSDNYIILSSKILSGLTAVLVSLWYKLIFKTVPHS